MSVPDEQLRRLTPEHCPHCDDLAAVVVRLTLEVAVIRLVLQRAGLMKEQSEPCGDKQAGPILAEEEGAPT